MKLLKGEFGQASPFSVAGCLAIVCGGMLLSGGGRAASADHLTGAVQTASAASPLPAGIRTVFLILFENKDWFEDIKGSTDAPFINSLLPMASYCEAYYNPPGEHPSLRNYVWLEAGSSLGITNNQPPVQNHQATTNHLSTMLFASGVSWMAYMEGISGTDCPSKHISATGYMPNHNPFANFDDVINNTQYCIAHHRPYTALAGDLQSNTVARYNFITPVRCNDGHDACPPLNNKVRQLDNWLSNAVPPILNSQPFQEGGALFITFDEGSQSDGPIAMILLSPLAKGNGYFNTIYYNHSSMLRTMQTIFGVSPFIRDATNAVDLSDLFVSSAFTPASLSISPSPADLGTIPTGTTLTVTLTVTNAGALTLNGTATAAAPLTLLSGSPYSLAGGDTTNVRVQLTVQNVGPFSYPVIVRSNGGNPTNTVVGVGSADTPANSWINSDDGRWDDGANWSLAVPPKSDQLGVFITNQNTKTVTIDAATTNASGTMTVRVLSVSAPDGTTNTLRVTDTGTFPLNVLESLTVGARGALTLSNAILQVASYSQNVASTLLVEIGSDASSPIQVQGPVTLAGSLKVRFADGFAPTCSNSWVILTNYSGRTGTFDNFSSEPALSNGLELGPLNYDDAKRQVTISVRETQPPTITCPADVLADAPPGENTAQVSYPAPAVSACAQVACNPPSGAAFPLGTNSVACTATNSSGTDSSCVFRVIVQQNNSLVARFNASPTSGPVPLLVNFSDTSSGSITGRSWDFGDGGTLNTSLTNVSHAYNAVGVYSVGLTVNGPQGSSVTNRPGYIVVSNAAISTVTISATDSNAREQAINIGKFTVNRVGGTNVALTVRYDLSGSATAGIDYSSLSGMVLIPANSANATIVVTPVDDALVECKETVIATLATSAVYKVGSSSQAIVDLKDNDLPTVTIAASDPSASEPGSNKGAFTVTRTGCTNVSLRVNFTVSGTAVAGSDYQGLGTSISIQAGKTSGSLTVKPIDDASAESAETVVVTLVSNSAYLLGANTSATVTIADNESVQAAKAGPTPSERSLERKSFAFGNTWEVQLRGADEGLAFLIFADDHTLSGYGISLRSSGIFTISGAWRTDPDGRLTGRYVAEIGEAILVDGELKGTITGGNLEALVSSRPVAFGLTGRPVSDQPDLAGTWLAEVEMADGTIIETYELSVSEELPGVFRLNSEGDEVSGAVVANSRNQLAAWMITGSLQARSLTGSVDPFQKTIVLQGANQSGAKITIRATKQ